MSLLNLTTQMICKSLFLHTYRYMTFKLQLSYLPISRQGGSESWMNFLAIISQAASTGAKLNSLSINFCTFFMNVMRNGFSWENQE